MKSPLLLLSLVLLGFSGCQSNNKPAADADIVSRRTPDGLTFTLATSQLFAPNDSKLSEQAAQPLEKLAARVKQQNAKQLIIRSYTDDQGDDGKNLALTQGQAQSVATWLREHGINAPAELQGMGEANPVAPNAKADGTPDPAGQAQNRRVEVVLLQ